MSNAPTPQEALALYRDRSDAHMRQHMRELNKMPIKDRIELILWQQLHINLIHMQQIQAEPVSVEEARKMTERH